MLKLTEGIVRSCAPSKLSRKRLPLVVSLNRLIILLTYAILCTLGPRMSRSSGARARDTDAALIVRLERASVAQRAWSKSS